MCAPYTESVVSVSEKEVKTETHTLKADTDEMEFYDKMYVKGLQPVGAKVYQAPLLAFETLVNEQFPEALAITCAIYLM